LYNQKSNSTVKLIDRFEFSVANFNNHSKWKNSDNSYRKQV
jgi:hypothetical protein